ncbi:MAG: alpha/beta hydrolase [Nitriliruptorales bacterium]|nr:alpha/beta hydrolase [Nitriliruptorales bacterium]
MEAFELDRPWGTLRVLDAGGAGAPLVVAHGVGSSAQFVHEAFGAPLADAGWRVVAFDLRGHGGSSPARRPVDHRLEAHAEDLWTVAAEIGARAVGGISLGGHAAVAVALEDPSAVEVVLACIPAWTGRAVPGTGPHAAVAERVRDVGIRAVVTGFESDDALPRWLRRVLIRDWTAADAESLRVALEGLEGGMAPTEAELRRLTVPLAVVAWPDDPGHPIEVAGAWADWAPRASLETLPLDDLEEDLESFGRAAARALDRLL